jgi:hypothetical protein
MSALGNAQREADRQLEASVPLAERFRAVIELGLRDLRFFAAARGLDLSTAEAVLESNRQRGRRSSAVAKGHQS